MSTVTKIAAALLVLLALVLGVLAYRLAVRPAPPPAPRTDSAPARQAYPVVVAAKPIAAGTQIQADDLKVEQWLMRPDASYGSADKLLGEYVRLDIAAGQPLSDAFLSKGLARYLEPGQRAVTIAIDEISGAQNRVQPGDLVDLFFMLERNAEVPGSQTRLLQSRVKVLAFGAKSVDGPPRHDEKAASASGSSRTPPPAPRNAVLAVPVENVNELLLAAKSGRVQMVLRAPQDEAQPDPDLFVARAPVLVTRPGLSAAQQAQAKDAVNAAYAGEILPQLAGPAPAPEPKARPAARTGGGRSIEVVRGTDVQAVRY